MTDNPDSAGSRRNSFQLGLCPRGYPLEGTECGPGAACNYHAQKQKSAPPEGGLIPVWVYFAAIGLALSFLFRGVGEAASIVYRVFYGAIEVIDFANLSVRNPMSWWESLLRFGAFAALFVFPFLLGAIFCVKWMRRSGTFSIIRTFPISFVLFLMVMLGFGAIVASYRVMMDHYHSRREFEAAFGIPELTTSAIWLIGSPALIMAAVFTAFVWWSVRSEKKQLAEFPAGYD